jgi:hypothetical protein
MPEPASAALAPSTTVYGETSDLEAAGRAALERFADAGLELPVVELALYESADPCRRPDGTERAGVTLIHAERYDVRSCGSAFTVMHELAHVWDHHNLDDERRAALLELRGLESWRHETWAAAGGEHSASIIAWGLTGVRPAMVPPSDDMSLAQAYELLTGGPAPTLTERGLELVDGKLRRVASLPPAATASAGYGSNVPSAHTPR